MQSFNETYKTDKYPRSFILSRDSAYLNSPLIDCAGRVFLSKMKEMYPDFSPEQILAEITAPRYILAITYYKHSDGSIREAWVQLLDLTQEIRYYRHFPQNETEIIAPYARGEIMYDDVRLVVDARHDFDYLHLMPEPGTLAKIPWEYDHPWYGAHATYAYVREPIAKELAEKLSLSELPKLRSQTYFDIPDRPYPYPVRLGAYFCGGLYSPSEIILATASLVRGTPDCAVKIKTISLTDKLSWWIDQTMRPLYDLFSLYSRIRCEDPTSIDDFCAVTSVSNRYEMPEIFRF